MGLKYQIADFIVVQKARWGKGQGEFGILKGFLEMFLLIQIYFATKTNYQPSISLLVLVLILLNIFYWIIGWLWDIAGLYIVENEYGNKRNHLLIELRKKFNLKDPNGKV